MQRHMVYSTEHQAVLLSFWLLCGSSVLLLELPPARAVHQPQYAEQYSMVPLLSGSRPEGVTAGSDNDLWVACLSGKVLHVDLASNTTTLVHQEHGVALSGAKFCTNRQILFAAGSLSGKGYIFHMQLQNNSNTGQSHYTMIKREVVKLYNKPGLGYINDVALSEDRVYFSDSFHPTIYSISRDPSIDGANMVLQHHTGGYFYTRLGQFRANGLAVHLSSKSQDQLLVANTHTGHLYNVVIHKGGSSAPTTLQPTTGRQQEHTAAEATASTGDCRHSILNFPGVDISLEVDNHPTTPCTRFMKQTAADVHELQLPKVPGKVSDTLLLDGVWFVNSTFVLVADNYNNRVWGVELGSGLSSARLSCLIQLPVFGVPTTITSVGGRLWITNAHLDTCFPFLPCPRHQFEVIGIDLRGCKPWPEV